MKALFSLLFAVVNAGGRVGPNDPVTGKVLFAVAMSALIGYLVGWAYECLSAWYERKRLIAILAALIALVSGSANAASCFWVGGAGTWSTTNTASWASSTGGTGGTCGATGGVPKNTADAANFDANSGAVTVTADSTLNGLNINQIVATNFTGTLDFTVNNPSMTLNSGATAFSIGSTGIAKLGSGTFTFSAGNFSNTSSATQSFGSSTLVFISTSNGGTQTLAGNAQTFGTVTVNGRTTGQAFTITGANTISTLNLSGTLITSISAAQTITNLNVSGSASQYVMFPVIASSNTTITLTLTNVSISRAMLRGLVIAGATNVVATNSYDIGDNTMNTGGSITPPSGGGGYIIGGN